MTVVLPILLDGITVVHYIPHKCLLILLSRPSRGKERIKLEVRSEVRNGNACIKHAIVLRSHPLIKFAKTRKLRSVWQSK